MTVAHQLRRVAQRFGIEVTRYPAATQDFQTVRLLEAHGVQTVVDVGAHTGGYAKTLRLCGYSGRIVSLEPVADSYRRLVESAAVDPCWETVNCAAGDSDGTATINIAGNDGASSSVLPMLARHTQKAPESAYVGTEEVRVRRLDGLWQELDLPARGIFLKLDVQGYELQVLSGLGSRIEDCVGLQLEMSTVPLYARAGLYRDTLDWAEERGFSLMNILPGFADSRTGQMYQFDAVLFREPVPAA